MSRMASGTSFPWAPVSLLVSIDPSADAYSLTSEGNLPTEKVTKRDIFHRFFRHGTLAQISIKQAYGFVQFLDASSAHAALKAEQGKTIRGRKMRKKPLVCDIAMFMNTKTFQTLRYRNLNGTPRKEMTGMAVLSGVHALLTTREVGPARNPGGWTDMEGIKKPCHPEIGTIDVTVTNTADRLHLNVEAVA